MQWFGATYTKRFNLHHNRSGHLFQGRYKNMLVQNDAYLLQLSYYIHRNPLRAGMVRRLADYKWSSYRVYGYGKSQPNWLHTQPLLSQFINVEDTHRAYRENIQKYAKEKQRVWEDLRHGVFVGTEKFVNKIKKRYLPNVPHAELPSQKQAAMDILKLANGDLDHLSKHTEDAIQDFRDVVSIAEYPRYTAEIGFEKVSKKIVRAVIDDDWRQYREWLEKD